MNESCAWHIFDLLTSSWFLALVSRRLRGVAPSPCLQHVVAHNPVLSKRLLIAATVFGGLWNMPPRTGEAATSRAKWTMDVHVTVQVALVGALVVFLFALLHRGPEAVEWPLVQGDIQDTRIVADHAIQTKWGGELTWKAEYKIAYFVASREYAAWTDSGIRGESEAGVRLALPKSLPSCRVQYNPKRPEESVAIVDESRVKQ
jgi:hypothetical protein